MLDKLYYASLPFTAFAALAMLVQGAAVTAAMVLILGALGGFAVLCVAAWLISPSRFMDCYRRAVAEAEADLVVRRGVI